MTNHMTRRRFITATGAAILATAWPWPANSFGDEPATAPSTRPLPRYKISVCDWFLLKRQKPGALKLAQQCGMDGVEVDMGPLGTRPDFENTLRDPAVRKQYLDESRSRGVEISSIAMSAFYGQSWADHPNADALADEWIETMSQLGVTLGFLPMGVKSDIKKDDAARRRVIDHLKVAAPKAEKAGIVLGIESTLDIDGHKRFLDDVASPAVKVYYNLGDGIELGYDIYSDLRALGRERLAALHCKEGPQGPTTQEVWLGEGRINFPKVKEALDEIGWSGWLTVERSRHADSMRKPEVNYSANAKYLKSVFQAS